MIIPQIAENLTRSGNIVIPETCPVCGQKTHIREENETKTLYCINIPRLYTNFATLTSRAFSTEAVSFLNDFSPNCGQKTHIREENETKTLYCINEECPAKKIKQFTHFVSRDAMNIEGLSEATSRAGLPRCHYQIVYRSALRSQARYLKSQDCTQILPR